MLELILLLAVISSAFQYCLGRRAQHAPSALQKPCRLTLSQNPNVQIAAINSSLAKQEQRRAPCCHCFLKPALGQVTRSIESTSNRSLERQPDFFRSTKGRSR